METWKSIEGYEGLYEVSDKGQIRSLGNKTHKGVHIMKQTKNHGGYYRVCLNKFGKRETYRVHRLVASAFIPNPNNFPQVNHKDEDKTNNSVENLEWCSEEYNQNYGTRNYRISISSKGKKKHNISNSDIFSDFN